jgi:hypothetical protein
MTVVKSAKTARRSLEGSAGAKSINGTWTVDGRCVETSDGSGLISRQPVELGRLLMGAIAEAAAAGAASNDQFPVCVACATNARLQPAIS